MLVIHVTPLPLSPVQFQYDPLPTKATFRYIHLAITKEDLFLYLSTIQKPDIKNVRFLNGSGFGMVGFWIPIVIDLMKLCIR